MNKQSLPWFRMYTDFLNDPKMIAMAFEDQRHFIGILALKSDGALDQGCDGDLLDRIVAQRLWIDHGVIRDVKRRLIGACLIDERWQPTAWEKRQCRSDKDSTGAERQRRFRENHQRNALRNGDITRPDIDRETDKEEDKDKPIAPEQAQPQPVAEPIPSSIPERGKPKRKRSPAFDAEAIELPGWLPADLWARWVKHRSEIKKPITEEAARSQIGKLTAFRTGGWDPATVVDHCIAGGYQGLFLPPGHSTGSASPSRTAKFDPLAYVNRNRIRPQPRPENDDGIIDV